MTETIDARKTRIKARLKPVLLQLPPDLVAGLDRLWPRLGYGKRTELVREVLRDYLERAEKRLVAKEAGEAEVDKQAS